MICIICRLDKDDMSDEHVIPDSLNGYYHIYNVCKSCNSSMGDKIDSPLVNHQLTKLYRSNQEIPGKSGKIPKPFSGIFYCQDNPENKARVDIDKDGNYEVIHHPIIKIEKDDDGEVQRIEIEVNSKSEGEIDGLLKKVLSRHNIPKNAVFDSEWRREERNGKVFTRWEIDTLKFKIGLLKIAYEFAVDSISEYFMDEDAVKISEILKNTDYFNVEKFVKIGSGLESEVFDPFIDYLDLDSNNHYLVLCPSNLGLLCYIKLHKLFTIGVVLSSKHFIDISETIVGVNNCSKKIFEKYLLSELMLECLGPNYTKFGYSFVNDEDRTKGQIEIDLPEYRYEGGDKIELVPLYKKNGERHPFFLDELIHKSEIDWRKNGSWLITNYFFPNSIECYVKSVGTGNLYKVVAFENSVELIKKV